MNEEDLKVRIAMIKEELEKTKATFIKYEGHLQEAEYWLSEIQKVKNDLEQPIEEV